MIAGEAFHHRAIAAFHENIRDGFADGGAVGNCKQMVLSLGLRDRDQIGLGQSRRIPQQRLGNSDLIAREPARYLDGRVDERGKAA